MPMVTFNLWSDPHTCLVWYHLSPHNFTFFLSLDHGAQFKLYYSLKDGCLLSLSLFFTKLILFNELRSSHFCIPRVPITPCLQKAFNNLRALDALSRKWSEVMIRNQGEQRNGSVLTPLWYRELKHSPISCYPHLYMIHFPWPTEYGKGEGILQM